jgi:hypothetical protein
LQEGQIGTSIGFDNSDDVVEILNDDSLNFGTGDFTISLWVKRGESGTSPIITSANPTGNMASSNGYNLFFTGTNGVRLRAQSDSIDLQTSSGSITPADGWTLLTVVGVQFLLQQNLE